MQLKPDYLTSEDRETSVKLNRVLDIICGLNEAMIERVIEAKKLTDILEKERLDKGVL